MSVKNQNKAMKKPDIETRLGVARWRLWLFEHHYGAYPVRGSPVLKRGWLYAKTRALVESDRLLMCDDALKRVL